MAVIVSNLRSSLMFAAGEDPRALVRATRVRTGTAPVPRSQSRRSRENGTKVRGLDASSAVWARSGQGRPRRACRPVGRRPLTPPGRR